LVSKLGPYTWQDEGDHWMWLHDAYGDCDVDMEKVLLWRTHILLYLLGALSVVDYYQFYEGVYAVRVMK